MKTEIEELIPHRFPFLFVDDIISADENEIVGRNRFERKESEAQNGDSPFIHFVPGMIVVESMAQCGGAGAKKAGSREGFFVLAGIEQASFLKGVPYGEEIRYVIKNLRVSSRIIKQTGSAYLGTELLAEATWTCARIE